MSLTVTPLRRTFLYNGRVLPDPDSSLSPEQVKQFYSAIHADLTNALVEACPPEGDAQVYEFKRGIGTKG